MYMQEIHEASEVLCIGSVAVQERVDENSGDAVKIILPYLSHG